MRDLSQTEKNIIDRLLHKGISLEMLLGNVCNDLIVKINRPERQVSLIRKKDKIQESSDVANDMSDFWIERLLFISTLMKLLDYLEQNGYIISHLLSNTNDPIYFVGKSKLIEELKDNSTSRTTYDFDDIFIIDQIIKYCYRVIFPTEALKILVKNNYKTQDEIRFSTNYRLTIYAILVSLFIGLSGLCISIISLRKPTTINSNQINELSRRLDSIYLQTKMDRNHIDSLNLINE